MGDIYLTNKKIIDKEVAEFLKGDRKIEVNKTLDEELKLRNQPLEKRRGIPPNNGTSGNSDRSE